MPIITPPKVIEQYDSTENLPIFLPPDQTAQGIISNTYDYDYYTIPSVAFQKYSIALIGTGSQPLNDPYLSIVFSGIDVVKNDDAAPGISWSQLTYTALTTGTFTVKVRSYGSDPGGQYGLSVTTGNQFNFDYLMGGGALHSLYAGSWGSGIGQSATVTYGFRETPASYAVNGSNIASFTKLSYTQINAVNSILALWSDICGIKFQAVNSGGYTNNATLLFGNYNDTVDAAGAFAFKPVYGNTTSSSNEGDVWFNISPGGVSTTLNSQGTYSYNTIMHEIGHALGLTHPGSYQASAGSVTYAKNALFTQDSSQYTVMSYFDGFNTGQAPGLKEEVDTPLLFDIIAMQNIYGANMSTRTGDTVYGFGSNAGAIYDFALNNSAQICIWDAAGIDSINCSGYKQNQYISLMAGSFSNIGGGVSNLSIALNVSIENALGGGGSDVIVGNESNNKITGNSGNDSIDGGVGIDIAIFSGISSNYTISRGSTINVVSDKIVNRDGADTLTNIERLKFSDQNIALDLAPTQSSGKTALLLGTVLPGKLALNISNHQLIGTVINLFDQGYSLQSLSGSVLRLPIWDVLTGKLAPTTSDIASYLVNNIYGGNANQTIINSAILAMTNEGAENQGTYLANLALSEVSQNHIGLIGIQASGLVYTAS